MTRDMTRADRNILWIESYCSPPDQQGLFVSLTEDQRATIRRRYDNPDGCDKTVPIADQALAAYLTLLHLCGPEASRKDVVSLGASSDLVWAAAGSRLRSYLERDAAGAIACRELGTRS